MGRRPSGLVAAGALAAGLGLGLGLGACSAITDLVELEDRIEDHGYDVSSAFHDDFSDGRNEVTIEAEHTARGEPPPGGQLEIAEVVWETYPRRFDRIVVELDDDTARFTRGQLQERFGPRDPELDEQSFNDDVRSGVRAGLVALIVVLVAGSTAIVVTLVVLRSRSRRPPPPSSFPPPPPPGPPPGWVPPAPPSPY